MELSKQQDPESAFLVYKIDCYIRTCAPDDDGAELEKQMPVDVDYRRLHAIKPLISTAARHQKHGMIKWLLSKGADCNDIRDVSNQTALFLIPVLILTFIDSRTVKRLSFLLTVPIVKTIRKSQKY